MHKDIKLILLMVLNFIYSLSLIGSVFFYSLMGAVATDRVGIIVTEATGFQRQETLISANLMPTILVNIFGLSLAGVAFCLIFIFLLRHSFHAFWAPASLSVLVFFFLLAVRSLVIGFLPPDLDVATGPYIVKILDRGLQANIIQFIFGLLLFYIAYHGDKYFLKNKGQESSNEAS